MATKKDSTPRPCTLDIDGFPGASVYRIDRETYYPMYLGQIVGSIAYRSQGDAEPAAIAAWVQARPEADSAALAPDPDAWRAVSAAPIIVPDPEPEPLHPEPAMSTDTFAAVWDARSQALAGVAAALQGEQPPPSQAGQPVAVAHVSLDERIELRQGQHSWFAVAISEGSWGYCSDYLRPFADPGEGRTWIATEAARRAGAGLIDAA